VVNTSLEKLHLIGPLTIKKFSKLNIHSSSDLIRHWPYRYEDYGLIKNISSLKIGNIFIYATLDDFKIGRTKNKRLSIIEAIFSDNSGVIKVVWFNQPYLSKSLRIGESYYLRGKYDFSYGRLTIQNPKVINDYDQNNQGIVNFYPATAGLKSLQINKIIHSNWEALFSTQKDNLPKLVSKELGIYPTKEAIKYLHYPQNLEQVKKAQRTITTERIFSIIHESLLAKADSRNKPFHDLVFHQEDFKSFINNLPYELTDSQKKNIWYFITTSSREAANILMTGDVGSGKTIVALMMAIHAILNNKQVLFIAPTASLVRQHYQNALLYFTKIKKKIDILTAANKKSEKDNIVSSFNSQKTSLLFATHSIFKSGIDLGQVGLIIFDEEHKFGVEQRRFFEEYLSDFNITPHLISMSATPIPRSLAMSLFANRHILFLETIKKLRQPITTQLLDKNDSRIITKIKSELKAKHQIYIVIPRIGSAQLEEESEIKIENGHAVYEEIKTMFSDYKVEYLHSKKKVAEKEEIMTGFTAGEIDILIATTMIEVGIDNANATVMWIRGADFFGLSTLHQLRGRVGRSSLKSFCFISPTDKNSDTKRLKVLEKVDDGFALAQADLATRGPGEIFGPEQSGLGMFGRDILSPEMLTPVEINRIKIVVSSYMKTK
jgi:ATP-dependent DNA helicase RecG